MIRPGDWSRAICVASGPSLNAYQVNTAMQAQRVYGWRVFVVSDNYRRVPSADAMYSCDGKWYRHHYAAIVAASFGGEKWTQIRPEIAKDREDAELYRLNYVSSVRDGKPREPGTIRRGGNSGLQMIDLASSIFGGRTVVLIGYDMQRGPGGKMHWFGDHPKPLTQADDPKVFIPAFDAFAPELAAAGVRVINASAETALRCFERMTLDEAIGSFKAAA